MIPGKRKGRKMIYNTEIHDLELYDLDEDFAPFPDAEAASEYEEWADWAFEMTEEEEAAMFNFYKKRE